MPRWLLVALLCLVSVLPLSARAADRPDFLVDADWLAERLKDPKLVLLEVRYHPHRHATVGHIPGAVQVQRFADLGANDEMPIMRFPSRAAFQATLRRWGINDDSTVLVYDDSSTALASRVIYLLDLYGFDMKRVKLLDGGTIGWTGFNELTKAPTAKRAPGKVTLKARAGCRDGRLARGLSPRRRRPRAEHRAARCPAGRHVRRQPHPALGAGRPHPRRHQHRQPAGRRRPVATVEIPRRTGGDVQGRAARTMPSSPTATTASAPPWPGCN
jgi:rhodanese-related sulfurtransferase